MVGNLPSIVRQGPIDYFAELQRRHGDHFVVRFGRRPYHIVIHPDLAEQVLWSSAGAFRKESLYDEVRRLTGDGLLTLEGEPWRGRRKLMQPSFHRKRIQELTATMVRCTAERLEDWRRRFPTGGRFDAHEEFMKLTLEVVGETLFGQPLGPRAGESGRAFGDALVLLGDRGNSAVNLPLSVPTPSNRRLKRALALLDEHTYGIIARARETRGEGAPSLLTMLLESQDAETGAGLSDEEVRNEVITLFLAGHETTALTLSWAQTLFPGAPDAERRMHDEVRDGLRGAPPDARSLRSLTYTRRVVDEVLRLRSPVWSLGRDCVQDTQLGEHRILAGEVVLPLVYLIHRHPAFWGDDPERFDPDRFLPEPSAARHKWAYLPFSLGERQCIGQQFSLVEATVVLAMMSQVCRLRLVGDDVAAIAGITYRPAGPVEVELEWL